MHRGRCERVLRLLHDPAGVIRGRDDAVAAWKADPPRAAITGLGYRVIVQHPLLLHRNGGHSHPAARQIDRSVPVGISPRWFGTDTLSRPALATIAATRLLLLLTPLHPAPKCQQHSKVARRD